jgi:prophage maintenance system killer protein
MVWYPTVDDVISANKIIVRKEKHAHRLRRSTKAIQSLIDDIKTRESLGLTYLAARFLKELVHLHAFDGGNHRTAYAITNLFLIQNGIRVRTVPPAISYKFVRTIQAKDVNEVQAWMLENIVS